MELQAKSGPGNYNIWAGFDRYWTEFLLGPITIIAVERFLSSVVYSDDVCILLPRSHVRRPSFMKTTLQFPFHTFGGHRLIMRR